MEEAERKEQERIAQQKTSSWMGSKKTTGEEASEQPKAFKASPWAVAASKGEAPNGINFAPIKQSDQERKMNQGNSRQEQEFVFVSKK